MAIVRVDLRDPGRGSAWLERLVRDQEVGGSNPLAPTTQPLLESLNSSSRMPTTLCHRFVGMPRSMPTPHDSCFLCPGNIQACYATSLSRRYS